MRLKKLIGQIHLWLGLLSGLVVFILGITGCILAFEEEIKDLVYEDLYYVDNIDAKETLPLSSTLEIAKSAYGSEKPIHYIGIENDKSRSYIFRTYVANDNKDPIWYWDRTKHYQWLYLDPYSGEVIKKEDRDFTFFYVVVKMHVSLLFIHEIGRPIVGWSTLVFVMTLITGLVLWWPKNKKALKANIWFRWKKSTKWKRKNYDLHNIVGFYSMFLAMVIGLTGLMWSFEWFNNSVRWMANGGKKIDKEKTEMVSTPSILEDVNPMDKAFSYLQTNHSQARFYGIRVPKDSLGTIGADVKYSDNRKRVLIKFDQYTGEILDSTGWDEKSNGEKLYTYNEDIHIGAVGGLVGKTIAFFISLFSASLPITGFLIWYGRKFKK